MHTVITDGQSQQFNNKKKIVEKEKLFTQQAVEKALQVTALAAAGLCRGEHVMEELKKLPEGLSDMSKRCILAACLTRKMAMESVGGGIMKELKDALDKLQKQSEQSE